MCAGGIHYEMVRTRRRRRRRRKTPTKTQIFSRKGKNAQARQIHTLAKTVRLHDRKLNDRAQYTQYKLTYASDSIGHALLPADQWGPTTWKLIRPVNWVSIFQTRDGNQANVNDTNLFRGRSIGIEHMFQLTNPQSLNGTNGDPVTCTLFIVTLRKESAQQFLENTNGGTDLTQGVHFTQASMGTQQGAGMVMLNKGIFKIRYMKRFMLGANIDFRATAPPLDDQGVHTTNLRDNNRRIYTKLAYPNLIKSDNGRQIFKQLQENQIEHHDQVYVYFFHNAYQTQFISWHANMVITGRETNA